MFFVTIFIEIFEFGNVLFASRFKISFPFSFLSTLTKLKLSLFLYFFRMAMMLGCLLYFNIAFNVGSFMQCIYGSLFENVEISRLSAILEKIFKTSAVSRSICYSPLTHFQPMFHFYTTRKHHWLKRG